ncbi:serine/threonine kinase [Aureococcus anophagefferens]|nr:serine/threonine kinase [Aureococcus anophagefferens]
MAAAPRAAPTGTPTDEAEVPHDIGSGYVIERKLGIGSYATVWLARTTASETAQSTVVAVKAIERSRLTKKLQENLESEIAILRDFSHPHLVGFVELRKRPAKIFLVLEYLAGGDLQKFIKARKRLKEPVARRFLGHLASGLKFLWSKNLIHRDLKPQNLLLTDFSDDGFLKIADFGFARHLETAALAETLCGSPLYMAPEILSFKRYDAKADLWSVGAVLFEMLAGEPPFSGRDHRELLKNIKRKALRLRASPPRRATMPLSRSLTRDRQPWKPPVAPPPPRLADLAQSGSDEFVVVDDFYATPGAR